MRTYYNLKVRPFDFQTELFRSQLQEDEIFEEDLCSFSSGYVVKVTEYQLRLERFQELIEDC